MLLGKIVFEIGTHARYHQLNLLGKVVFETGTHTCARTHARTQKTKKKKWNEKRGREKKEERT